MSPKFPACISYVCGKFRRQRKNSPLAWAMRKIRGLHSLGEQNNSRQSWYFLIKTKIDQNINENYNSFFITVIPWIFTYDPNKYSPHLSITLTIFDTLENLMVRAIVITVIGFSLQTISKVTWLAPCRNYSTKGLSSPTGELNYGGNSYESNSQQATAFMLRSKCKYICSFA